MIIDDIPGFEGTPEKINSAFNKCLVFNIIDNLADSNNINDIDPMARRCAIYKKLLDDRRALLKMFLRMHNILFYGPITKEEIFESEVWALWEQVTGKSWKEWEADK